MGAWLQKVTSGYYQYHAVPGNLPRLQLSGWRFAGCGARTLDVAANARGFDGSDSPHSWTGGFLYLVSCILTPMTASTPLILSKSRMRYVASRIMFRPALTTVKISEPVHLDTT